MNYQKYIFPEMQKSGRGLKILTPNPECVIDY